MHAIIRTKLLRFCEHSRWEATQFPLTNRSILFSFFCLIYWLLLCVQLGILSISSIRSTLINVTGSFRRFFLFSERRPRQNKCSDKNLKRKLSIDDLFVYAFSALCFYQLICLLHQLVFSDGWAIWLKIQINLTFFALICIFRHTVCLAFCLSIALVLWNK